MNIRIITVNCPTPAQINEIPVDPKLHSTLQQTTDSQWDNLFGFIRLSLQGRITGKETPDEIKKLQGQIEFIPELISLFKQIAKVKNLSG